MSLSVLFPVMICYNLLHYKLNIVVLGFVKECSCTISCLSSSLPSTGPFHNTKRSDVIFTY